MPEIMLILRIYSWRFLPHAIRGRGWAALLWLTLDSQWIPWWGVGEVRAAWASSTWASAGGRALSRAEGGEWLPPRWWDRRCPHMDVASLSAGNRTGVP